MTSILQDAADLNDQGSLQLIEETAKGLDGKIIHSC